MICCIFKMIHFVNRCFMFSMTFSHHARPELIFLHFLRIQFLQNFQNQSFIKKTSFVKTSSLTNCELKNKKILQTENAFSAKYWAFKENSEFARKLQFSTRLEKYVSPWETGLQTSYCVHCTQYSIQIAVVCNKHRLINHKGNF